MDFNFEDILNWIKDKASLTLRYWWVILTVFIATLIVIWIIKRLLVGINSSNY